MGSSSQNSPATPTRSGRTQPSSPTPVSPQHASALLRAAGRGPTRGISRGLGARMSNLPLSASNLPLSTSTNALGRGHGRGASLSRPAAQPSGIPSPVRAAHQSRPSGSTSSRGLSTNNTIGFPFPNQPATGYASPGAQGPMTPHVGPLTGNPTTASQPIAASGGRGSFDRYGPGPLRPSLTPSNLPVPSPRKNTTPASQSRLPRPPPEPRDIAYMSADAWTVNHLKVENIPPSHSGSSLGTKHRDSLSLASTKNVPRISPSPPSVQKKESVDSIGVKHKGSVEFERTKVQSPKSPPSTGKKSIGTPGSTKRAEAFEMRSVKSHVSQKSPAVKSPASQKSPAIKSPASQKSPAIKEQVSSEHVPRTQLKDSLELTRVRRNPSPTPTPSRTAKGASDEGTTKEPSAQPSQYAALQRTPQFQQSYTQFPEPTPQSSEPKTTGIPKSRTRNVFSNLTASFSRTSLPTFGRTQPRQPSSTAGPPAEASTPTPASRSRHPRHEDPRFVGEAMPFKYWSGRFVTLQDKLQNELLLPGNMNVLLAANAERQKRAAAAVAKPGGLPTSHTMAAMPPPTAAAEAAAMLADEDARARRVFLHLAAFCTTPAARDSLYDFQQEWARQMGKEDLLPPGGSMTGGKGKGKGWVGRMFSGDKDKGKKGGPSQ
ncbi:hypothetical protein F4804DRAFT_353333 [Jackrogersella minutella]|nr:hypothetical protein F4804DRAFT_353333 [Jackrogersella minutella]